MNLKAIVGFILTISITGLLFYMSRVSKAPDSSFIKEYNNGLKTFNYGFVNHFPNELSTNSNFSISNDISTSHPGIKLKTEVSTEVLDTLLNYLNLVSIAKYLSTDSCLLVIDSHLTEDNWLKFDKTSRNSPEINISNRDCYRDKFPVPKFWKGRLSKETQVGLNKEFELYIIDSKAGLFISKDSLPNGKYTYKGWEHGYSKGIAVNKSDNVVIYWFDIW